MDNLVCVLGLSRSGKTIFSNALLAHTYSLYIPEDVIAPCIPLVYHSIQDPVIKDALKYGVLQNLFAAAHSTSRTSRISKVQRALHHSRSVSDFLSRVFAKKDFEHIVYESNFMSLAPELTAAEHATPFYVVVVRDALDTAIDFCDQYKAFTEENYKSRQNYVRLLSYHTKNGAAIPSWVEREHEEVYASSSNVIKAVLLWKAMYKSLLNYIDTLSANQFAVVRFEELVEGSPDVFKEDRLCFLNSSFEFSSSHTSLSQSLRKKMGLFSQLDKEEIELARGLVAEEEAKIRSY